MAEAVVRPELDVGLSERMLRVGAEHFELGAEELQLVEGVGHPRIGGVALYLGIELRDSEARVDDIAFELGDVNAVRGESAE